MELLMQLNTVPQKLIYSREVMNTKYQNTLEGY